MHTPRHQTRLLAQALDGVWCVATEAHPHIANTLCGRKKARAWAFTTEDNAAVVPVRRCEACARMMATSQHPPK